MAAEASAWKSLIVSNRQDRWVNQTSQLRTFNNGFDVVPTIAQLYRDRIGPHLIQQELGRRGIPCRMRALSRYCTGERGPKQDGEMG
jgi:hypothetical protein